MFFNCFRLCMYYANSVPNGVRLFGRLIVSMVTADNKNVCPVSVI